MTQLKHGQAPSGGGFVATFPVAADSPRGFAPLFGSDSHGGAFVALNLAKSDGQTAATSPAQSAREILEQAHEQAARVLAEVKSRTQVEVQAAAAEAVAATRTEHVAAFSEAATTLLDALHQRWEENLQRMEAEAAGLLVALCRRVLHEHFTADETSIVAVVREALRPLAESARVEVVVAAQHEPALRDAYAQLAQVLREEAQLQVTFSETAPPFGCVAHGDQDSLDARLETRLELVQREIDQAVATDTAA